LIITDPVDFCSSIDVAQNSFSRDGSSKELSALIYHPISMLEERHILHVVWMMCDIDLIQGYFQQLLFLTFAPALPYFLQLSRQSLSVQKALTVRLLGVLLLGDFPFQGRDFALKLLDFLSPPFIIFGALRKLRQQTFMASQLLLQR
jgi:hypothetical protein